MQVLNTGVNPAGSAITKDERYLYVANNNSYGLPGQDSVSIFDLKHNKLVKTIYDKSFNQPYTITIDHGRNIAYVTNANSPATSSTFGTVTKICTKTHKVIGVIGDKTVAQGGMDGPSGFAILGDFAFVNNYGGPGGVSSGNGKTVSVVDLDTDKIVKTIKVSLAPAAVTVHDRNLYVACYVDGNPNTGVVNVISTKNYELKGTIEGFSGPFALAISNGWLYVTNFGSNNFAPFGTTLSAVKLNDQKSSSSKAKVFLNSGKRIEVDVGIQPSGLAIINERYIAVSCYNTLYSDPVKYTGLTPGQGSVVIIDTNNWKSVTIPVGQSLSNITYCSGKFYISSYTGNVVYIFQDLS